MSRTQPRDLGRVGVGLSLFIIFALRRPEPESFASTPSPFAACPRSLEVPAMGTCQSGSEPQSADSSPLSFDRSLQAPSLNPENLGTSRGGLKPPSADSAPRGADRAGVGLGVVTTASSPVVFLRVPLSCVIASRGFCGVAISSPPSPPSCPLRVNFIYKFVISHVV
jgi:hypothetical protein